MIGKQRLAAIEATIERQGAECLTSSAVLELVAEIRRLQAVVADAEQTLIEAAQEVAGLNIAVAGLQARVAELEEALAQARRDYEGLRPPH